MDTHGQNNRHDSLPSPVARDRASMTETKADSAAPATTTHDSMVTVRLSEPPSLTLNVALTTAESQPESCKQTSLGEMDKGQGWDTDLPASRDEKGQQRVDDEQKNHPYRNTIISNADTEGRINDQPLGIAISPEAESPATLRDSTATMPAAGRSQTLQDELGTLNADDHDGNASDDQEEVDWEQLEKTEGEQVKDEETDNSTALLLARLEQENAKLATNPKSVKVQAVDRATAERSAVCKPRPPSMAQLRQMVNGPTPPALRYSMLPPPPMTDLEFYAALVKDYQQTAARLPTLLSNKIRKGIPPPLRGVVWQSMSGARDAVLEEQYERFCGESSPYEPIIGKDLGRSFPGVDMFRDSEGDGQRMLGRVLKCFSLYDTKIGYCQGLAFLVGPLLMHMPDKQAFCVLVRLMERYDLRACFLPDLSGLHVRIYQFRELLRRSLPALSNHLEHLQVDPAYVSQWFLSFFAVTCPLPMLFRIYDVIFAEGASETLMRVALSLMRKNETRLLAYTEIEDVMQLLLSRGVWDCYHYNADEFVQDFAGLSGIVTIEIMQQLEQEYRESKVAATAPTRASEITTAASRFLGRIWASPKSANLSPGNSAPSRPLSMLRRSTSKQSLASTLNSMEASSASVTSSASTDVTTMSRDSSVTEDGGLSRESTPVGSKLSAVQKNSDERHLHSQIEDLLTALSELQRSHALLSNQLQREREDRQEDSKAVRSLLDGLKKRAAPEPTIATSPVEVRISTPDDDELGPPQEDRDESVASKDVELSGEDCQRRPEPMNGDEIKAKEEDEAKHTIAPSEEDLSQLLEMVERRFVDDDSNRRSSTMLQSKAQLREEVAHMKDQLAGAMSQSQEYNRQLHALNQEVASVREQLRESHAHVRSLHQDKQRLERQVQGMKSRVSANSAYEAPRDTEPDCHGTKAASVAGLREFKLGRSVSTPTQAPASPPKTFSKRISSLPRSYDANVPLVTTTPAAPSPPENEALLLELVQAKTAEAMAKQEAEEARQKLESLRKTYSLSHGDGSLTPTQQATGTSPSSGAMGVFGLLTGHGTGHGTSTTGESTTKATASAAGSPNPGGGFWGWRR